MVSREGEEAEYHETDSNLSTPPRMGSIKISARDPLQNRLSIESCSKFGASTGEIPHCDYTTAGHTFNQNVEVSIISSETTAKNTIDKNHTKDVGKESIARVPPILQIENGNVTDI